MTNNPPLDLSDFFMSVGGIPTLSGLSTNIGGIGTSKTSRVSPRPASKAPSIPSNDTLADISEHLKVMSRGIEKLTHHFCTSKSTSLLQTIESIDSTLDDDQIIVICKNPLIRDDIDKAIQQISNGRHTLHDSISSAVNHVVPGPDVDHVVNQMNMAHLD